MEHPNGSGVRHANGRIFSIPVIIVKFRTAKEMSIPSERYCWIKDARTARICPLVCLLFSGEVEGGPVLSASGKRLCVYDKCRCWLVGCLRLTAL